MSDVERRLLRAGRSLRELEFEPPPLPVVSPSQHVSSQHVSTRRIPVLAMPVLALLAGLAVMAGMLGRDGGTEPVADQAVPIFATPAPSVAATAGAAAVLDAAGSDDGAVATSVPAGPASGQGLRVLTAYEEVVMIGSLAPARIAPAVEPATAMSLRRF